jgi:hypothetical protein
MALKLAFAAVGVGCRLAEAALNFIASIPSKQFGTVGVSHLREIVEVASKMIDGAITEYQFAIVHLERCMNIIYPSHTAKIITIIIHGYMIVTMLVVIHLGVRAIRHGLKWYGS